MKKVVLSLALAFTAILGNAQVVKNDLLNGYTEGNALEKGVYTERGKKAPLQKDTWCAAATTSPVEGATSPLIGTPLKYEGYSEKGMSIVFGGIPEGAGGERTTVYSMEKGRTYSSGTYYLAYLVNLPQTFPNKRQFELPTLSSSYNFTGGFGQVFASNSGRKLKFTLGQGKENKKSVEMLYDFGKTHLVIFKMDYANNQLSLFIDPELTKEEPAPSVTIEGNPEKFKASIKAIQLKNRNGLTGNVGNFRFTDSWTGIVSE